MRRRALRPLSRALFAALVLAALARPAPAGETKILALSASGTPAFRDAVEGFRAELAGRPGAPSVDAVFLEGNGDRARDEVSAFRKRGGALVFALGSAAVEAATAQSELPVVATMVLRADAFAGSGRRATGVPITVPLGLQLEWLRRVLPGARSVGVLYDPEENGAALAQARPIAAGARLELVSRAVASPKELPAGLASLERQADVLWGLPDRTVYTPQTAKAILLFSFRNRIPLVGLSEAWVKAGALYALEPDYRVVGVQCAEMAAQILGGAAADAIAPAAPRALVVSLNPKTAEQMKVEIPPDVVRRARIVE